MNSLNTNETISFVNKLIDNVRCSTCEKLEGTRLRYECGHITCDDCVIYAQTCQICTPPSQWSDSPPKYDHPLTQTVKNIIDLLNACHNMFKATAFQRKKISDQLRIEKEIFPECIQAPMKYENKRKSSMKRKDRSLTVFPGELLSSATDMDSSATYVQQWLSKNERNIARKPFSDLNVNTSWTNSPNFNNDKNKQYSNENVAPNNRKRSHFKVTDSRKDINVNRGNKKSENQNISASNKPKKQCAHIIGTYNRSKKFDNDESGIFMEHDTVIIEDSQKTIVDKDKNAWLAVLEAEQNQDTTSTSFVTPNQVNHTNDSAIQFINPTRIEVKDTSFRKVPFLKRSAIIETCIYCKNEVKSVDHVPVKPQMNPIKITIDGDSIVTTISVYKDVESNFTIGAKNTVSVQTNISETDVENVNSCIEAKRFVTTNVAKNLPFDASNNSIKSNDIFTEGKKILCDNNQSTRVGKCVIIEESDSDTDLEASGPISVTVDFHRSDNGILDEVLNVEKHKSKLHHRPRRPSPTSTNSSEKENYNPNKMKRSDSSKKKYNKK